MPSAKVAKIIQAILDAIQESGHSAILFSSPRRHPRKFIVQKPDGTGLTLWVYIWTLTHGGRRNLPYEYRIQMTTVESPLSVNPEGITLLLGYDPNMKVFAGFDL
jgi:putative restriction endonuclease